jgi:hypothetical protein
VMLVWRRCRSLRLRLVLARSVHERDRYVGRDAMIRVGVRAEWLWQLSESRWT